MTFVFWPLLVAVWWWPWAWAWAWSWEGWKTKGGYHVSHRVVHAGQFFVIVVVVLVWSRRTTPCTRPTKGNDESRHVPWFQRTIVKGCGFAVAKEKMARNGERWREKGEQETTASAVLSPDEIMKEEKMRQCDNAKM
ncbi:uncharacterized protein SPSK_03713 [Sporothrix schenckii 1099-18]|uniref:Secreted protein n=1 Tax=Sporothrix schenckii 1099-18 TaxID=1397361 RepID=A0A0F2LXA8_SPOSC|nr:uncharacterized protein SPSK_03713 [Sporothrix schenckii 1099-18]KJR82097.1 hypothetical protein SPSK_03713 [Sporothrix schenckii 1099-18]